MKTLVILSLLVIAGVVVYTFTNVCTQCGNLWTKLSNYYDPDGKICNRCWKQNVGDD